MSPRTPKIKPVPSTPFSDFIRNSTTEEKERVYTEVMRKVSEVQNGVLARSTDRTGDSFDQGG